LVRPSYQSRSRKNKSDLIQMAEAYNILCNGRRIYSNLTEEEYFDVMEDLSIEFYQTGSPRPEDIETEILNTIMEKTDG